jgi:hypothetical protein
LQWITEKFEVDQLIAGNVSEAFFSGISEEKAFN